MRMFSDLHSCVKCKVFGFALLLFSELHSCHFRNCTPAKIDLIKLLEVVCGEN